MIEEDFLEVNEFSRPGRIRPSTLGVVMHWTANPNANARQNKEYFDAKKLGMDGYGSAHYIVGQDGTIVQCMPENEVAYHCGTDKLDPASKKVYTDYARTKFKQWAMFPEKSSPNWCTIGIEMCHQLLDDKGCAVGVCRGGIALGMRLKDVIHHRQAQAAHQFLIKQQVTVVHALTQAVEVLEQTLGLGVSKRNDGVLVQADAAADTVIVGRQEILQETVVGSKPLHLHAWGSREILGTMWRRHHDKVVLHDVVTALVEHKTPLARRAQQMHTGVA